MKKFMQRMMAGLEAGLDAKRFRRLASAAISVLCLCLLSARSRPHKTGRYPI